MRPHSQPRGAAPGAPCWSALWLGPLLALMVACSGGGSAARGAPEPAPSPPEASEPAAPPANLELDADGVVKLFPDAPGNAFRLGSDDPNRLDALSIEEGTTAAPGEENGVRFWTLATYEFEYAEGAAPGRTARLHLRAPGALQRYDWRDQPAFLAGPEGLGDQEFTAYVRVHDISDAERAAFELKIRGGQHTGGAPELASCAMMTFATRAAGVSRFGKELDHPEYDYVPLQLRFDTELVPGRWFGLKLVSFVDPADPGRVINRLYVDDDPFLPGGAPRNAFRLLTEYVDRVGVSTGRYHTLVNWRGYLTTLRVDGVGALDVAVLSARAISG